MQMQDYLPFFQELLLHYYNVTLEDPIYASCLAIAVWLATAMFYSIRIGILNGRNRVMQKAGLELQKELAESKQQIQTLQDEIGDHKAQIEQEVQRTAALNERISELGGQISESILALAANPELGQQGLTVSKGLEIEHLWQRFSTAVKLLAESLLAERKIKAELEQAIGAETAKLAEKDLELQATQTRFELQKQQLAKLEAAAEEHKNQLALQQQAADQRLAEVEARFKADQVRMASMESPAKPAAVAPKVPEPAIVKPVPVEPEIKAEPVQVPAAVPQPEPRALSVEPQAAAAKETVAPAMARTEAVKVEKAGGVAGKFKSLFAGAKQKMDKLDGKLGVVSDPQVEPEQEQPAAVEDSAETQIETEAAGVPEASERPVQQETAVKVAGGMGGKLKNLFGSSKKAEAEPVVNPAPSDEVADTIAAVPVEAVQQAAEEKTAAPGKIKGLFGKLKRNS